MGHMGSRRRATESVEKSRRRVGIVKLVVSAAIVLLGLWLLQRLTTKEPDESMVEVAIAAVEAVFDWKGYIKETFGYEVDESWMEG